MSGRWGKRLLVVVVTLPLLVWGCDRVQSIRWVGSTDLEVEFALTDDATGSPISGARVEVHQGRGGFYEDREEREFVLVSNRDGPARRVCRQSMCFGTRSGLGFTDTFAVHMPFWLFRVVADGYEPGEWTELDELEVRWQVRRAGRGKAKLVVPVSLHKRQAEPDAAPKGAALR